MMMLMMLLVMVTGNLISKEGDVCKEVKKSVDCIVLRTGRRHVPDQHPHLDGGDGVGDVGHDVDKDFGGRNWTP